MQTFCWSAPINLVQPLLDIVERLLVRDIVHDDDAVRAAVVAASDRAETLLAGGVPLRTEIGAS
jgi:hypothetical protein